MLKSKAPTLSAHSKRNPSKVPQQPRKRVSDTAKAMRVLFTQKRKEQAAALEEDLKEHWEAQEELIETLVLRYNRTEDYIRKVVCNGIKYGAKRAPSLYHAILHNICKKKREEGDDSNMREAIADLKGEEYQHIKASLSKEEQDEHIAQLVEHCGEKAHSPRATTKSCHQDAVQTINRIEDVASAVFFMLDLFLRTDVYKVHHLDVVRKMEQWAGNQENENTLDAVKSQISEMANDGLRKLLNKQTVQVEWSNYKLKMVHELGVELAGWPGNNEIKAPSKLVAVDAHRVRDLLRQDKIKWVVLTSTQREEVAEEIEALCEAATRARKKKSSAIDATGEDDAATSTPPTDISPGADNTTTAHTPPAAQAPPAVQAPPATHAPAVTHTPPAVHAPPAAMDMPAFIPASFPASTEFAGGVQPAGAAGVEGGFDPDGNFNFSELDWDLVPPPSHLGTSKEGVLDPGSHWILNTVNRNEEDHSYGANSVFAISHNSALANSASMANMLENDSSTWFRGSSYTTHGGFTNSQDDMFANYAPTWNTLKTLTLRAMNSKPHTTHNTINN
ncbi:hypothetical protein DFH07DRAFT_966015 [Mycena maculata]|uniref:Uncharacterized protein n=1 Tax=Mycena maculata TaxID=230809 RepID=A0AAD7MZ08_9AGAR|nr:hypothetical protein DFH07DRAFT_966015 [Mycena maculata]